jgi:hypothetical protein
MPFKVNADRRHHIGRGGCRELQDPEVRRALGHAVGYRFLPLFG